MSRSMHFCLALGLAAVLVAPHASAGGPLANCQSGVPYRWGAGGTHIPFNPDRGDLGPLPHAAAVAAVADAFSEWQDVATSTASYVQGAELPVDVTIDNFGAYLDAAAPDGLSAIVFDHTGEIFTLLYGANSGVLGFAGPEWGDVATCTITEGLSFLNGPEFQDLTYAKDVMVHEFGHYSNLAHTAVNGQIFLAGDDSGPTPHDTFGAPPGITVIETMYPFYFGPSSGTSTLQADDIAAISTLYPTPDFLASTGSISGTIRASNGTTRLSGVNVIARNIANPFLDAVSAVSGDFTDSTAQTDPVVGTYRLNGLTPGATYAIYVDRILDGGFSTPPIQLPGPEEFHSGAAEGNSSPTDPPGTYAGVTVAAGVVSAGKDVTFNQPSPGDPLAVGDDNFVQLALPFSFELCGQAFDSVFVNANGSLTFGAGSTDFSESVPEFLNVLPRIAGVWDDLNANAGGTVTFEQSPNAFTVRWKGVPTFGMTGSSNSFDITLRRGSNHVEVRYGEVASTGGLAGVSCGPHATSGFENEQALGALPGLNVYNMNRQAAVFELYTAADNALDGATLRYVNVNKPFRDDFESNDSVASAKPIVLPFDSASERRYTELSGQDDVDYFRFSVKAGDILAVETVRGSFDSLLGIFDAKTGALLAADDDGGGGLLSRLLLRANEDLDLAVAVSSWPDTDFNGGGEGTGRYVLTVNTYRGELVAGGDDTSTQVSLGFSFPFQGATYDSVFVNSNGNLTFGAGDTDFSESVPELLARRPRIAPLWDDLNAARGVIVAEKGPGTAHLHYVSVSEFGADTANYFSVGLTAAGAYSIGYGATNRSDALVGTTQGAGAQNPGELDLSARPLPLFLGTGTTYEQFSGGEPFDLNFRTLYFLPVP